MLRRARRRLLRIAFHLLYNQLAFTYDTVSRIVSRGLWHQWQQSILPLLDQEGSDPILELAHGTGTLQIDLIRAQHTTIALDLSPNMGRLAAGKLQRVGLSTSFVRGDALCLPFKSAVFPTIVCTFPTAFLFQPSAFGEMFRVLINGGQAIIVMSSEIRGGGFIGAVIRCLYHLTGQNLGDWSGATLESTFAGPGFNVETRKAENDSSAVQLLLLTKAEKRMASEHDHSLEFDA
jgi:ubiquinone/menaquinone biosynthesis C-methylase UbiE